MSLYSVSLPCLFIFNNQSPVLASFGTCFRGSKLHPELYLRKNFQTGKRGENTGVDREAVESFFFFLSVSGGGARGYLELGMWGRDVHRDSQGSVQDLE